MTSKRIVKALNVLNAYIDNDRQELSDKVKKLELSYNRMRKLLKLSLRLLDGMFSDKDWLDAYNDAVYLHKRITLELYGLENYKQPKGGV